MDFKQDSIVIADQEGIIYAPKDADKDKYMDEVLNSIQSARGLQKPSSKHI